MKDNNTAIRTVTKRKNQYSLTIPVRIAQAMGLQDKQELMVQYDAKTRTIFLNKLESVE